MGEGGGREREFGMFLVRCKYVTVCLKKGGRRRRGESEREGGGSEPNVYQSLFSHARKESACTDMSQLKKKTFYFLVTNPHPPVPNTVQCCTQHSTRVHKVC